MLNYYCRLMKDTQGSDAQRSGHYVQFRILTVDDAPPPPELAGPKDTIYPLPEVRYRLLVRFADHADPAVPYMYHCHMQLHEDEGMMGQFVVIEPGQEDQVGVAATAGHGQ